MSQLASQVAIIINTSYFTKLARDLILPSLPALSLYYAHDVQLIELSVSVYFIGILASRIFWPILVQGHNLKSLVFCMLGSFMLSSLLLMYSVNAWVFLGARFLQAFSIASLPILTRFFIFKKSGNQKTLKLYSYLSLVSAWSPAVATAIGGLIQLHYGVMGNFYCLFALGALSCAIYTFTLSQPKDQRRVTTTPNWLAYKELITHSDFWRVSLPFAGLTATHALYSTVSPFILMQEYHLSADEYGMITFILIAASVTGRTLCGRLIDFMSYDRLFQLASYAACLGVLVMLIALMLSSKPHLALILGAMMLFYLGLGLITPSAKVFIMDYFPQASAIALSLLGMVEAFFSGASAFIVAFFPSTWWTLTISLSIISLVAIVMSMSFTPYSNSQTS
jgi:MFS transporter, DHA1 family, multidrug resistance protein